MPEPTIGRETLPKVWIYICKFWIFIVATGAIVMVSDSFFVTHHDTTFTIPYLKVARVEREWARESRASVSGKRGL